MQHIWQLVMSTAARQCNVQASCASTGAARCRGCGATRRRWLHCVRFSSLLQLIVGWRWCWQVSVRPTYPPSQQQEQAPTFRPVATSNGGGASLAACVRVFGGLLLSMHGFAKTTDASRHTVTKAGGKGGCTFCRAKPANGVGAWRRDGRSTHAVQRARAARFASFCCCLTAGTAHFRLPLLAARFSLLQGRRARLHWPPPGHGNRTECSQIH